MHNDEKIKKFAAQYCGSKFNHGVRSQMEEIFVEIYKISHNWIISDVPKDGSIVMRWHRVQNVPCFVFYSEVFGKDECNWIESTKTNRWPEESFVPGIWNLSPTSQLNLS